MCFEVDTYVIVPESRDYWRLEEKMRCVFLLSAGCERNIVDNRGRTCV